MRGDFVAAGVIILVGACLLGLLFQTMDSDGQNYDMECEYGDWIDYDVSRALGTNGPIEIADGKLHATGVGNATVVNADGSLYRIKITAAEAVLVLINGQSNAAYYKSDGDTPDATDTPAPELGQCFYFGFEDSMPYTQTHDVSGCEIYDFVDPSTGTVRVGDKGPEFCKTYYDLTGKKVLWVSLGIPSKRIAAWNQPDGSAWTQNIAVMTAFNEKLEETGFKIEQTIVLWSQGESDYLHSTGYDNYIQKFTALHDAAPDAWGHDIDAWYLLEGRTAKVGWVNQAFEELASTIEDVSIATTAELVDTFTAENGLMEEDLLHYSQLGDNAVANAAARYIADAPGTAPIYLMESTVSAEVGETATAPSTVRCYRTDESSIFALCTWSSDPDTTTAGTFVIEGTAPDAGEVLEYAPAPMLIVTVTEAEEETEGSP